MKEIDKRNKYFFGLGTIGRDMFYAFESNAILYFLSHVLQQPLWVYGAASFILTVLRIVDAINDPITGLIIDNIRSPWGKFKPAILVGGLLSVVFYLVLFGNIGTGWGFVIVFGAAYLLWDISFGINDIAYWTLLPALTTDQKQRESNGTFSRICASIGSYSIMMGWEPITKAMGNTPQAWLIVAVVISVLYMGFLCFTLFGVKENPNIVQREEKTSLGEMWGVLLKNDQLMWTTLSMGLFMIGYVTTVNLAIYYMEYVLLDKGMYVVLVAVVGVVQLATLAAYQTIAKHFNRRQLYTMATALVVAGYLVFGVADIPILLENGISIFVIAFGGVLVFCGQALIQTLMLMFLADTVEYGQWKLGKRNESITFSIQPLVNKIGGALSTGLVTATVVLSGIKTGEKPAAFIDATGKLIVKGAMFFLPLLCIVAGYIIYLKKYKISEEFYAGIIRDLKDRGDLKEE
jgi:melibiose permease/lactose/raffinose/galactose permease